jgi:hypothetical protein
MGPGPAGRQELVGPIGRVKRACELCGLRTCQSGMVEYRLANLHDEAGRQCAVHPRFGCVVYRDRPIVPSLAYLRLEGLASGMDRPV